MLLYLKQLSLPVNTSAYVLNGEISFGIWFLSIAATLQIWGLAHSAADGALTIMKPSSVFTRQDYEIVSGMMFRQNLGAYENSQRYSSAENSFMMIML